MASTTHPGATVPKPPEFKGGLWTSWIPLTTAYSGHDSQCTSKFWQLDVSSDVIAWDPGLGVKVSSSSDLRCVPQAATTWWDQTWLGPTTETVVSIGPFTCPEAFTQVATSVVDAHSTQVACCPSGYLFVDWMPAGVARQCYSDVSADASVVVHTRVECDKWIQATTQLNTSPTIWAAHINGWVFAAEQTAATSQSSETTSQSPEATSPPSETVFRSSQTTSQPSGTISPPCSSCNSSNSDNAKSIGIGVGASLAAVGMATLIAGLIMMRRSKKMLRAARHGEEMPKDTETQKQDSRNSHERPVSPAGDDVHARQPYGKPAGELYGSDPTLFHSEAPAPQ